MRRFMLVALAALAACRVSGATFHGPGSGGDGGDDDVNVVHYDVVYMDAPPAAMRYAFLIDSGRGVYEGVKNADGSITFGTLQSLLNGVTSAVSPDGQYLYVARFSTSNAGAIQSYSISGSGNLSAVGAELSLGACGPVRMTIASSGHFLVVGCNLQSSPKGFAIVPLTNHLPSSFSVTSLTTAVEPGTPILSADDHCLFVSDNKVAGGNNVYAYTIDGAGATVGASESIGPDYAFAMTVDANAVYVAGKGIKRFAINTNCKLDAPTSQSLASPQRAIAFAPSHMLFSAGTDVNVWQSDPLGTVTTMQRPLGGDMYATAVIDPGTPQFLYLTASTIGTERAVINADGSVGSGSRYAPANSTAPVWLQLVP